MRRSGRSFWADNGAAIAPLYALALFALIGMGGVGFDYARMMALDSELQNAADQAALAAATQLDGREGAMVRARDAANNYLASSTGSFTNETVFANETNLTDTVARRRITSLGFNFYDGYNSADDTFGTEITDDDDGEDAAVVQVTVNSRRANYALTPIVSALTGTDVSTDAVAGLQSATCNVPPLMFCSPSRNFPGDADIGKGLKLHMKANQADIWAPGNFGFLDIEYPDAPSGSPNSTLGWNSDNAGCAGEDVESRTGSRTPEVRALNTRFDIYGSGAPSCDTGTGNFCPSQNTSKNWVRAQTFTNRSLAQVNAMTCSWNNSDSWVSVESTTSSTNPATNTGFPQDTCFGTGSCNSFGDGVWAGAAYMTKNHSGSTLSDIPDLDDNGSITRYEVYMWELDDIANRLTNGQRVGDNRVLRNNGNYNGAIYCAYPKPVTGTGVASSSTQKDRRVMTVAAVDCTNLSGHGVVDILRWVDLFMVQPADDSASEKDFFAEIKSSAEKPDGTAGFQYFGRNKPVLLR